MSGLQIILLPTLLTGAFGLLRDSINRRTRQQQKLQDKMQRIIESQKRNQSRFNEAAKGTMQVKQIRMPFHISQDKQKRNTFMQQIHNIQRGNPYVRYKVILQTPQSSKQIIKVSKQILNDNNKIKQLLQKGKEIEDKFNKSIIFTHTK